MNEKSKNATDVYNYLKETGCCDACCLRFLDGRCDDYLNIRKSLEFRGVVTLKSENLDHDDKRLKTNPCTACLDLLTPETIENVLENIFSHPDIGSYKCETVLTTVSLPVSLQLRQLALWIGLIKIFPGRYSLVNPPDVPLKEVVKLLFNPRVCDGLKKSFEQNQNGLMVNVFLLHENEANELKILEKLNPKLMKERLLAPRKFHKEFMTRNAFEKHFNPSQIDMDQFFEYVPILLEASSNPIKFDKITVQGPTVFVAGRYIKLIRNLPQSPWILSGKRMLEDSVQEIIMREVVKSFGVTIEQCKFSSSGREDVDVRCLGRGRPFVIEMQDTRCTQLTREMFAKIEEAVDRSETVSVKHLQVVQRSELSLLKSGEETKKKSYRALCYLKEPATVEVMMKLDISEPFTVKQLTPLRVLHRRPLHVREKVIHYVKGYVNEDDHRQIVLDIKTQAGTYVKELVHGEFGRTEPSIQTIIGQWIDIVELDVTDIDLDWPEPVE